MAVITAAAVTTAGTVYASNKASKDQKRAINAQKDMQNQAIEEQRKQTEALDPFAQYRPDYADKLNQLATDPSYLEETAGYKTRLRAAERVMAAQGYTGSGNALHAAANAASGAYQQEFDNLAMLGGVTQGQSSRASAYGTGANAMSNAYNTGSGAVANANDSRMSGIMGVTQGLANMATAWGNRVPATQTPAYTPGNSAGTLSGFGNNAGWTSNASLWGG